METYRNSLKSHTYISGEHTFLLIPLLDPLVNILYVPQI
jgi:hypothetical protein